MRANLRLRHFSPRTEEAYTWWVRRFVRFHGLTHPARIGSIPDALEKKYPNAGRTWPWQWVFPAGRRYLNRGSVQRRRHHLHESSVQRAVASAALRSGINKRATCHTFRH